MVRDAGLMSKRLGAPSRLRRTQLHLLPSIVLCKGPWQRPRFSGRAHPKGSGLEAGQRPRASLEAQSPVRLRASQTRRKEQRGRGLGAQEEVDTPWGGSRVVTTAASMEPWPPPPTGDVALDVVRTHRLRTWLPFSSLDTQVTKARSKEEGNDRQQARRGLGLRKKQFVF